MSERLLVFGGRDFTDRAYVLKGLDELAQQYDIGFVMTGGQTGTDTWGLVWASRRHLPRKSYWIDHALDGPWPRAGANRNKRMFELGKPTLGACTVGGPGTANMRTILEDANIKVIDL